MHHRSFRCYLCRYTSGPDDALQKKFAVLYYCTFAAVITFFQKMFLCLQVPEVQELHVQNVAQTLVIILVCYGIIDTSIVT